MNDLEAQALEQAIEETKDDLGVCAEEQVISALARTLLFDVEKARLTNAKRIVNEASKERHSKAAGAIAPLLPGAASWPYYPKRLIRDDEGNVTPLRLARPDFYEAETRRVRENADAQVSSALRHEAELAAFREWASSRPRAKATYDNFLRDTGRLIPLSAKDQEVA